MSVARIDACVATVVCHKVRKEACGGQGQKEYANVDKRLVEKAMCQILADSMTNLKQWGSNKVIVDKRVLSRNWKGVQKNER